MKIVFSLFLSKLTMKNILLGTQYYMPPEFMKTGKYDGCKATVWAMGILLVDMLSPVIPAFEKTTTLSKHGAQNTSTLFIRCVTVSLSEHL